MLLLSQLHPAFTHFVLVLIPRQAVHFLFFQTHPSNAQLSSVPLVHISRPTGDLVGIDVEDEDGELVRIDVEDEDGKLVGIDVGDEDSALVGIDVGDADVEWVGLSVSDNVGKLVDGVDGAGVGGSMRNLPYTSTSAKLKIPLCFSRDVPLIRTI